jgi:hypothetical protein
MPQPLVFTWAVVVDGSTPITVGETGYLVRSGYRVAPIERPVRIVRRDDHAELGLARFDEIRVAVGVETSDLPEGVPAVEAEALAGLPPGEPATVMRYVVEEVFGTAVDAGREGDGEADTGPNGARHRVPGDGVCPSASKGNGE